MLSKNEILQLEVGTILNQYFDDGGKPRIIVVCPDDDGNGPKDSEGFLFAYEFNCDPDETIVIDLLDMNNDGVCNDVWGTSWFELNKNYMQDKFPVKLFMREIKSNDDWHEAGQFKTHKFAQLLLDNIPESVLRFYEYRLVDKSLLKEEKNAE